MAIFFEGAHTVDAKFFNGIVALGKFEGMHLGHQALIARTRSLAKQHEAPSLIYSFSPHPVRVLQPSRDMPLICTEQQRTRLFAASGVDAVIIEEFTQGFANQPAKVFIDDILKKRLAVRGVAVGQNFRFGHKALGDVQLLEQELGASGIVVDTLEPVVVEKKVCSSSQIRAYVQAGQMREAAEMLGRWFGIEGKVIAGDGRGRTIGIPTINLQTQNELLPPKGVYATLVRTENSSEPMFGATNIGTRPTFSGDLSTHIETHILDFDGDLYGKSIEIFFLRKVRDEVKFASAQMLMEQIGRDVVEVRKMLRVEPNARDRLDVHFRA